jgi:hypothetical protein
VVGDSDWHAIHFSDLAVRSVPIRFLFLKSLSTAKTTGKQATNNKKRKVIENQSYSWRDLVAWQT